MKKKILFAVVTVVMTAAVGWNFQQKKEKTNNISNLAIANIEALADGEGNGYGTLYGSTDGSRFCCCSGSERTCSAASCPSSLCN
ncbi:MAG: NVEALA domain-containing protein [Tissierellia bacterium]|mgnify:CR=1 FL=1|jgi:hypothetical protein|nr:NVEALA domain-containing protein [Tissierellia bacterium]